MSVRVHRCLSLFPELTSMEQEHEQYVMAWGRGMTEDSDLPLPYDYVAPPFATRQELADRAREEAAALLRQLNWMPEDLPNAYPEEEIVQIPCEDGATLTAALVNEVYITHLRGSSAYKAPFPEIPPEKIPGKEKPRPSKPFTGQIIPSNFLRQSLLHIPRHESKCMANRKVIRYWPPRLRASHVLFLINPFIHETGSVRPKAAAHAVALTVAALRVAGLTHLRFLDRCRQNLVATCFYDHPLALFLLSDQQGGEPRIDYNPKNFPGAIVRHPDLITPGENGVTVLAFGGGPLICVGAKTIIQLTEAYQKIYPWVKAARFDMYDHDEQEYNLAIAFSKKPAYETDPSLNKKSKKRRRTKPRMKQESGKGAKRRRMK